MLDDFDIDTPPAQPILPRERQSPVPLVLFAIAILIAGGVAAWFFFMRSSPEQAAVTPTATPGVVASPLPATLQPLCSAAEAANATLPPLDDSDSFVSKAASGLSSHPRIASWLTTDDMIRRFVVTIDNIASGATPAPSTRVMRPAGTFQVRQARGELFIDPRSFERYGPIADAIESVDAQTAGRLCGTLKPRLTEAYGELGRDGNFDVALERAIVTLLRTPAAGPDTRLVAKGGSYAFEDATLESLTPAQKQLARMGPRNARIIQDKLRQVAVAIGIPSDRLPQ
jgi:hypothetical protein